MKLENIGQNYETTAGMLNQSSICLCPIQMHYLEFKIIAFHDVYLLQILTNKKLYAFLMNALFSSLHFVGKVAYQKMF
jgi:hypothetical protein